MTKLDAVWELMWDCAKTRRSSKASYRRVCKAIEALGLDADAKKALLYRLQYHDHVDQPYSWLQKELAK